MKTIDLIGPALDWAVAQAANVAVIIVRDGTPFFDVDHYPHYGNPCSDAIKQRFGPSYNWAQGGQIIEREHLIIRPEKRKHAPVGEIYWEAYSAFGRAVITTGPTPLVAAMRCYVTMKLGTDVTIPEEVK